MWAVGSPPAGGIIGVQCFVNGDSVYSGSTAQNHRTIYTLKQSPKTLRAFQMPDFKNQSSWTTVVKEQQKTKELRGWKNSEQRYQCSGSSAVCWESNNVIEGLPGRRTEGKCPVDPCIHFIRYYIIIWCLLCLNQSSLIYFIKSNHIYD